MKKFLLLILTFIMTLGCSNAASLEPVSGKIKLPAKYTQEYIDSLADEYKNE